MLLVPIFSFNNYKWFWIPIIAPTIGGQLGTLLYKSFINPFVPALKDKKFDGQVSEEMDIPEKIVIESISNNSRSMY